MEPEAFQPFELAEKLNVEPGQVVDFGTYNVTTGKRIEPPAAQAATRRRADHRSDRRPRGAAGRGRLGQDRRRSRAEIRRPDSLDRGDQEGRAAVDRLSAPRVPM